MEKSVDKKRVDELIRRHPDFQAWRKDTLASYIRGADRAESSIARALAHLILSCSLIVNIYSRVESKDRIKLLT